MTQYALPISDNDGEGSWAQGAGDGDGDHFDEFDEGFGAGRGSGSGPDDLTSYWIEDPLGTTFVAIHDGFAVPSGLSSVTDPATGSGHIYRVRGAKSASAGKQVDLRIMFIATGLAEVNLDFVDISNTWTTREDTLTTAEADSITDYSSGMEVGCQAKTTGGGAARTFFCSAQEFECPDAGGATGQPTWKRWGGVPFMGGQPRNQSGRVW